MSTAEILKKLGVDAAELLGKFGILFIKNYGAIVFEKVVAEQAEQAENEQLRLKYRPFEALGFSEAELNSCECYVCRGDGPGTFVRWKQVFVVEQADHSINIYDDEKAHKDGKQPIHVIRPAGYKAVGGLSKVSEYYAESLRDVGSGLGLTELEVKLMTQFSPYSWALAHPQRPNYVFQLHQPDKSCSKSCKCFRRGASVEPDEAAYERSEDLVKTFTWMKACVTKSDAECNSSTETARMAFRRTCQELPDRIDTLKGWSDNGTEAEMLVDMLMEALLPVLRDPIFEQLKGPTSVKLAMWNKIVAAMTKALVALVEPAWEALQRKAFDLEPKVEQKVRPAIAKIVDIKAGIEEKIREKSTRNFDSEVDSHVTPFIQPIIDAFKHPLKKGFELEREALKTKLEQLQELVTDDKEHCRDYLDQIARSTDMQNSVKVLTQELIEPLEALKVRSPVIFSDVDIDDLQLKAGCLLLQTLDAAAYTVFLQLDADKPLNDEVIQKVLMDFDYDVVVKRCHFINDVAKEILIPAFKKLMMPVIAGVSAALNTVIPEDMNDFLNIENVFDKLIEKLAGKAIDEVVTASYPLP